MILIVMGVTGSGKTTVGEALARRLELPFYDGDNFHPPANREKLRKSIPLGDEDRWPWLELLARKIADWERAGGAVVACSALKQNYREVLRKFVPQAEFVYVAGERDVIAARLRRRAELGHDLINRDFDAILSGQYRDLEEPEDAIRVSNLLSVPEIVDSAVSQLEARRAGSKS